MANGQLSGTLINEFGVGGKSIFRHDTMAVRHIYDLDVDINNKIVIGGAGNGNYFIVRLNPDDKSDSTFCFPNGYKSIDANRSSYYNMKLTCLPDSSC